MKHKGKIVVATVTIAVVSVALVSCFYLAQKQAGVRKLLMPGTYTLQLNPDTYSIWYFWQWPTKNVDESNDKISISIVDEKGTAVERSSIASPGPPVKSIQNQGRLEFSFKLQKDSKISVNSPAKCVIVIVPTSAAIYEGESGFFSFFGSFDDFNFEERK